MERRAITSQEGTLSRKFHVAELLCSAGLVLFTTQGVCSEAREISLSAEDTSLTYIEATDAVAAIPDWQA